MSKMDVVPPELIFNNNDKQFDNEDIQKIIVWNLYITMYKILFIGKYFYIEDNRYISYHIFKDESKMDNKEILNIFNNLYIDINTRDQYKEYEKYRIIYKDEYIKEYSKILPKRSYILKNFSKNIEDMTKQELYLYNVLSDVDFSKTIDLEKLEEKKLADKSTIEFLQFFMKLRDKILVFSENRPNLKQFINLFSEYNIKISEKDDIVAKIQNLKIYKEDKKIPKFASKKVFDKIPFKLNIDDKDEEKYLNEVYLSNSKLSKYQESILKYFYFRFLNALKSQIGFVDYNIKNIIYKLSNYYIYKRYNLKGDIEELTNYNLYNIELFFNETKCLF